MLTEQEKDGLLRVLEREIDSGNLLALYRDGADRLMLEVRHGNVIELNPVLPQRMTRKEAEQELAASDLEMLGGFR